MDFVTEFLIQLGNENVLVRKVTVDGPSSYPGSFSNGGHRSAVKTMLGNEF